MTITVKSGPWNVQDISNWLEETVIPIRLATTGKRGPLVQSMWFEYTSESLWCATQRDSAVARRARKYPVIGWEVSPDQPPYRGVRGRGTIEVIDDAEYAGEVLHRLIHRYGQSGTQLENWLLSRVSTESALRITDLELISWDFSPRMRGE